MRRVPIVPTIVVLAAVAVMVWLGIWQIHRAQWKEALLASYEAAEHEPALYGLPADLSVDDVAFRRAHIVCRITTPATQIGGADAQGRTGFRNIVGCALIDGRAIMADLGWSAVTAKPALPAPGQGIESDGRLIPDDVLAGRVLTGAAKATPLLLVLDKPAPGLEPSVPPSIGDIPNNHRSYAVQWFLFAGIALVIYALALRKRLRARG